MIWGFVGWQAVLIVAVLILATTVVLSMALYAIKEIVRAEADKSIREAQAKASTYVNNQQRTPVRQQ